MSEIPSYDHLSPEDQAACHRWNSEITPHNNRLPALSEPPAHLLDSDGYKTYEEAKAVLDDLTRAAGFISKVKRVGGRGGIKYLVCNRGEGRPSTATKREAKTIKVGCQWAAVLSCNSKTEGKWKYTVKQAQHSCHAPQTVPEAEKGFSQLTAEQIEFAKRQMADPLLRQSKLEGDLRRQFPDIAVRPSVIKNFMANHRKAQRDSAALAASKRDSRLEAALSQSAPASTAPAALPSGKKRGRPAGSQNTKPPAKRAKRASKATVTVNGLAERAEAEGISMADNDDLA